MRRSNLSGVGALMLGLCLFGSLTRAPLAGSAAGQGAAGMSAESFLALDALQKPLEPDRMDPLLLSAAIYHETNARRTANGLPPLAYRRALEQAARQHADSMVRYDFVSHINPREPERRTLEQRLQKEGLTVWHFIAENIATQFRLQCPPDTPIYRIDRPGERGYSLTPQGALIATHTYRTLAAAVVDQWMGSEGHRRNLLAKEARSLGAGCALKLDQAEFDRIYCVQVFSSP